LDRQATIVATLADPPTEEALASLPVEVGCLEVRADLVGDLDIDWLRDRFAGRLLYTLRSRAEGGRGGDDPEDRRQRLTTAARGFDLVDLEADRDLDSGALEEIDPARRLVSWHGPCAPWERLRDRLEAMSETEASIYKIVPAALLSGEELEPLKLLHHAGRSDVVAFAGGVVGAWTRQLAPYLGAPIVYGGLGRSVAPGQPSVRWLIDAAGLPALPEVQVLFGLVGNPVSHSLSPRLHNRMYREIPLAFLYVPFHVERFGDFWLEVVESGTLDEIGFPLRGLSVTTPHKAAALAVAGAVSPLAERVGAVNTMVQREAVWEGENTDCEGVVRALEAAGVTFSKQRAIVVGSGRAGRAAAFALANAGSAVTVSNRSEERGREVAHELGLPFVPLSELSPRGYEIVVNATSLGRRVDDPLPFAIDEIDVGSTVVDLVYGREATPLVAAARERGLEVVEGVEILVAQAVPQFRLMTNREMTPERGREVLGLGARA